MFVLFRCHGDNLSIPFSDDKEGWRQTLAAELPEAPSEKESSLKEKNLSERYRPFAEYGLNAPAWSRSRRESRGTTKRMVVYHFKNKKENLYLLVLEYVYTDPRQ